MPKKKNLTISLDETLIGAAKEQAERRGLSLNEMIRDFLGETVQTSFDRRAEQELFNTLDEAAKSAKRSRWSRSDAYDE